MIHGTKIGIVIPTCSTERAELLAFVEKRMAEQTLVPDYTAKIDYPNTCGKPDLAKRYKEGVQRCFDNGCELVFFIEDDDYYPKTYIESMYWQWVQHNKPHVIGCKETTYYHIFSGGYTVMHTRHHASAHGTAISRGADFLTPADYKPFYDISLWELNAKKSKLVFISDHCISIKHGIGECGGKGHDGTRYSHQDDKENSMLKQLVDDEAFSLYRRLQKKRLLQSIAKGDAAWDKVRTGLEYAEVDKDICILFYPDANKAAPLSRIRKICDKRGIKYHNDPTKEHNIHFYWSYHPAVRINDSITSNAENVINKGCGDITKKKVNDIFNDISIDPTTYQGIAVEKAEQQGAHGLHKLVTCPCTRKSGYVYQRLLVDEQLNEDGTKYYIKYRIYYADGIGFILKQVKGSLFGSDYVEECIVPIREYFSEDAEIEFNVKCMQFGVDCAEIDFVLENNIPIIIDVNNVAGIVASTPEIEQARENLIVNFFNHRRKIK